MALSVAFADYARKFFNISPYRATQDEIERYLEEVELYHERVVNLQYKPSAEELRTVVSNLAVCVDGLPTEQIEVNVHANLSRKQFDGKDVGITNRVRGGVPLVLSSIVQKAKSVSKEVKKSDLDWSWMNGIIMVDKSKKASGEAEKDKTATFLEELVAGRPIFAYPKHIGGFRLRYGRARTTGIAAKGFSPATAILTMEYIGIGTQLKVEFPGKGCVAAPVDTIEGPFIKLKSGEALRVNDAETARLLKDEVAEIISLGDILITYGDFKKTNTPLQPSSYVEEFWQAQLDAAAKEPMKIRSRDSGLQGGVRAVPEAFDTHPSQVPLRVPGGRQGRPRVAGAERARREGARSKRPLRCREAGAPRVHRGDQEDPGAAQRTAQARRGQHRNRRGLRAEPARLAGIRQRPTASWT